MNELGDIRALIEAALAGGWEDRRALEARLEALDTRLRSDNAGPAAIDDALVYLELDPYYFWSGYARARMARRLAGTRLDADQLARARRYVLDCVDGAKHCGQPALGQLARSVADNPLRGALRDRLQSPDTRTANRALRTLLRVRHPGLTNADVERARELVLAGAALTPWLLPSVYRLARWLWDPQWEEELRALTRHHGPERAAAKKLVETVDRRRAARRPGP